jgi:hypothetical protein
MKYFATIEVLAGTTLLEACEKVFGMGYPCRCSFNGHTISSDDDIDTIFLKIVGKTKAAFEAAQAEFYSDFKKKEQARKELEPLIIEGWKKKGEEVLQKKYHELWYKLIPERVSDIYGGRELGNCLEVIATLNGGASLDDAKILLEKQGHSGLSHALVINLIHSLCERGGEFALYVK